VIETELPRVQCDRPQPFVLKLLTERTRRTVLSVADDRMAARRALNPNMMRPTCLQFNFEPCAGTRHAVENAVTHDSDLAARVAFGHDDRLRHAVTFVQVVSPSAFLRLNVAFDYCPIHFCDRAILELAGQALCGTNMPRENNRTRDRPVEPMRQPQVDVALFLFAIAVKRLHANFHAIDAGGRLRQHAGRLVHNKARPVVVQDFQFRIRHETYIRLLA